MLTDRQLEILQHALGLDRESPAPPKAARSQQRYRRFLNWADVWGGTFREFLEVEKMRRKEGISL